MTVSFFVYDGVLAPTLGWTGKQKIDDGSSSEHGLLANWMNKAGYENLPSDSPWRMDQTKYMAIINYQTDTTKVNAPANVKPYAASGNEINTIDKQYYKP